MHKYLILNSKGDTVLFNGEAENLDAAIAKANVLDDETGYAEVQAFTVRKNDPRLLRVERTVQVTQVENPF